MISRQCRVTMEVKILFSETLLSTRALESKPFKVEFLLYSVKATKPAKRKAIKFIYSVMSEANKSLLQVKVVLYCHTYYIRFLCHV